MLWMSEGEQRWRKYGLCGCSVLELPFENWEWRKRETRRWLGYIKIWETTTINSAVRTGLSLVPCFWIDHPWTPRLQQTSACPSRQKKKKRTFNLGPCSNRMRTAKQTNYITNIASVGAVLNSASSYSSLSPPRLSNVEIPCARAQLASPLKFVSSSKTSQLGWRIIPPPPIHKGLNFWVIYLDGRTKTNPLFW